MSQFREEEAQTRLNALTPASKPLDRAVVIDGNEVVLSMKDVVQRALHSHVDALYFLIGLFGKKLRNAAVELQANAAFVQRMALAANTASMEASSSKLTQIVEVLDQLQTATTANRNRLLAKLSTRVREFTQSSQTATGIQKVGVTPAQAREAVAGLLPRTEELAQIVLTGVGQFFDVIAEFKRLGLNASAFQSQAQLAKRVMEEHTTEAENNLSTAVLDSILLESLLTSRLTVIDPDQDKYVGPVVASVAGGATLFGTTLPLILQSPTSATLLVDDAVAGNLTAPASTPPIVNLSLPSSRLVRTEKSSYTASGPSTFAFSAKPDVRPNSIRINATIGAVPLEFRDDGVGLIYLWSGFALTPPAIGSVFYDTGVMAGDFVPTYAAPDVGTQVTVEVEFALLGKAAAYDEFNIFQDNELLTESIDLSSAIFTEAALAAALDAVFVDIDVAFGTELGFVSVFGGSAYRLAFPDYPNILEVNPNFGAPKFNFLRTPTNVNQVLLAFNSAEPDAQGADTGFADLVKAPAIESLLRLVNDTELVVAGSVEVTAAAPATLSIEGVLVDDVIVMHAPIVSNHRVVSISPTTVDPDVLMPFDSGEDLVASATYSYSVRRDRLRVVSEAVDTTSALEVLTPGLGLAGSSNGVVTAIELEAAPIAQYSIRKGDVLIQTPLDQSGFFVGEVTSVNGTTLGVSMNALAALPLTEAVIRPLGKFSLANLLKTLDPAQKDLQALLDGGVFRTIRTYVEGTTGPGRFTDQVTQLQGLAGFIATVLGTYRAGTVNTIAGTLAYLREEKMTLARAFLLNLQLEEFDDLTAAAISQQATLEDLLEQMSTTFGASEELVDVFIGDTLLGDYTERGRDVGR